MPRILVVEDEPDIALGLQEDLRCHGHEVETVADGESAARRGKEPGWDLILLDLMLPRMDGYEVCQQLRHAGVRTPIIMLTAKTHEARRSWASTWEPTTTSPNLSARERLRSRNQRRAAADLRGVRQGSIGLGTAKSTSTAVRCGGAGPGGGDRARVPAALGVHPPPESGVEPRAKSSTRRGGATRPSPTASSTPMCSTCARRSSPCRRASFPGERPRMGYRFDG